jgi:HK97 family phage major capsid protein
MPYNSLLTRTNATALIPEEVTREIIQGVAESSSIMRIARRLPNMSRAQLRMPVLSALATAYFVSGDVGLKQTTDLEWTNKYINAEEIACIVPIPENVLADADYDIWAEARPRIIEAFGVVFDAAVLHGTNAPAAWPSDIVTAATAAGNTVTEGAGADIYDDIMGETGTLSLVEADGYNVSAHVGAMNMKAKLRGLRDADGMPLFVRTIQDGGSYDLDGSPIVFPLNGALDTTALSLVSGDWSQVVYSIRQDMTWKLLDQAVIQDGAGNIIYNLAQQDMVALRAVMRVGWQVPNPINRLQETEASRYPLTILVP